MKNRIAYIDIAKGIAILLVVMAHVLCYDIYGFDKCEKSVLFSFIQSFHMPLFFFLSGLVVSLPNSIKLIPSDIYKRFRTFIVPMLVVGGVYSLINNGNFSYIFNAMKYGYWFLLTLFMFYFTNYINMALKYGGGRLIAVVFVYWMMIWRMRPYVPQGVQDIVQLVQYVIYLPYFMVGYYIKYFNLNKLLFTNPYFFLTALLIWILSYYVTCSHYILQVIVKLNAIIVVLNVCQKMDSQKWKCSGILSFLGRNTLYIYLFHFFALNIMKMDFLRDFFVINGNFFLDLLIVIIPTSFAVLFSLFFKKTFSDTIIARCIFNKQIKN